MIFMLGNKELKNNGKYYWTNHVKEKMRFYGISDSLVKRILRFPQRTEEGIALNTIASMKAAGSKRNQYELWVMYQVRKTGKLAKKIQDEDLNILNKLSEIELNEISKTKPQIVVISAWKYPGITQKKNEIPIPDDVRKIFGI